ncbi:MAG TPA: aspartate kinase, partial [Candidatus Angelobacter sp.]|nr:aspartate kinase [Candidatus Angelobacter sp.]
MYRKRLTVMKFGGTSVGNAERFRQCAAIVGEAAKHDRIVVVVSAMAGVTDLIFKTIEAARHGDASATQAHLEKFESVHRQLIVNLLEPQRHASANDYLAEVVAHLQNACAALSALRSDISAQTSDSLVALGERISAWTLANYLQQLGTHAEFVRAENVIATDSNFGNAAPDIQATRKHCQRSLFPLLDRSVVPVVAGYSGADALGKSTTLGRGGSDYSATIIGAAAGADEVWIWTDVDGVLTADPRICPDAAMLPEISFEEAIELAYYGAKVIHPKAAYPAAEAGFPVWIKNSFRPEVAGTKITHDAKPAHSPVKAVTSVKDATL